jgi:hypothetical protein
MIILSVGIGGLLYRSFEDSLEIAVEKKVGIEK